MNSPGTGEQCPGVQQDPRSLSEVLDYPSLTPVGPFHLGGHPGVTSGAVCPGTGQTVCGWDAEHPFCIISRSFQPQAAAGCSPTTEVPMVLYGKANLGAVTSSLQSCQYGIIPCRPGSILTWW